MFGDLRERERVAERVRAVLAAAEAARQPEPPRTGWVPPGPPARPAEPAPAPVPSGLARWRIDPGRRGALAVGAVAVLAAIVTAFWVFRGQPQPIAVTTAGPSTVTSPSRVAATVPVSRPAAASIVVDVVGRVRHPGVYALPSGARVETAIRAAGGFLPGTATATLNLAARLSDGQQIAVGVTGAVAAPGADPGGTGSSGSGASTAGPVDLNTATLDELQTLPGVGPVLAQHILDWRTQHGPFTAVTQLRSVSGIGPAKFAALQGRVTV